MALYCLIKWFGKRTPKWTCPSVQTKMSTHDGRTNECWSIQCQILSSSCSSSLDKRRPCGLEPAAGLWSSSSCSDETWRHGGPLRRPQLVTIVSVCSISDQREWIMGDIDAQSPQARFCSIENVSAHVGSIQRVLHHPQISPSKEKSPMPTGKGGGLYNQCFTAMNESRVWYWSNGATGSKGSRWKRKLSRPA